MQPVFVPRQIVVVRNVDSGEWEEAEVMSFEDGFYEVEFGDGTHQCCDSSEMRSLGM